MRKRRLDVPFTTRQTDLECRFLVPSHSSFSRLVITTTPFTFASPNPLYTRFGKKQPEPKNQTRTEPKYPKLEQDTRTVPIILYLK